MNYRSKVILLVGIIITLFYLYVLYRTSQPFDELKIFLESAPFNERGDFLAGVFGPITILWLIIGYLIQAESIVTTNNHLIEQNNIVLHQIEKQTREFDPIFSLRVSDDRQCIIKNISTEIAKHLIVFYVNHRTSEKHIIIIQDFLFGDAVLEFPIRPPLRLPLKSEGKLDFELLLVYDTKVDHIRGQRFFLENATVGKIGCPIGPAGPLPRYFLTY